jgi:regulator of extracellular matrix RemA (YlzA/DUF370 family)
MTMSTELVHVGFGNILAMDKVLAIVSPASAPIKRTVQSAKSKGLLIDLTSGRKTKAVIIMDNGHIVLIALNPETIASRVAASRESGTKLD